MDLLLIILGLSVGGICGVMVAFSVPGATVEFRALFCVMGSFLGAIAGYFLAWIYKQVEGPTEKKPVRSFARQIVGSKCADCGEQIIAIHEGQFCPGCRRPFCTRCEPEIPCSKCQDVVIAEAANEDSPTDPNN